MWDLLKDYLEENKEYSYTNVDIISFEEDGHKCSVNFKHDGSIHNETLIVGLWDVLAYVHNKKSC